ncbi:ras-related and estrogen-regulated growth inhibitor-like protein [Notechis scutatus]|uniref:small monomeric GTPase n=1 Tax=Notechis scutatus TaxID=8663 RepID=A0A6J1V1G3_9SAUR|nr:ras-related and estrogen-regulated growth inhibitor-like protein [Notechis scutatus]
MNGVRVAMLGSEGTGKSALTVRFLTKRFIGEYASDSECIYTKHLCLDGKQINLEIYDPCSQPRPGNLLLAHELQWADGFVVVYDISDRTSFVFAKALLYRIRECHGGACKSPKGKEKRRPSGSKSMAKLINNMFGKRRKSV